MCGSTTGRSTTSLRRIDKPTSERLVNKIAVVVRIGCAEDVAVDNVG